MDTTLDRAHDRWSYCVTTTPQRLNDLLPQTLRSLRDAGFPNPLLSVDRCDDPSAYVKFGLAVTCHSRRLDNFANWYLAALETYLQSPFAEWYAVFEDDLIISAGAREYLEATCTSDGEYYHLWTDPKARKRASRAYKGWFLADQLGRGAVGLVFRRKPFMQLLSNVGMLIHATSEDVDKAERGVPRGREYVDGMIVTVMKNCGVFEMCHAPSIVQHVGERSSRHQVGRYPTSDSFRGESFDLRTLLAVSDDEQET